MKLLNNILILFIFVFVGCSSLNKIQYQKTDLQKLNLKGKLKSFEYFTYSPIVNENIGVKKNKRVEGVLKNYKVIFNEQGNKLRVNEYSLDGKVRYITKHKYNQKGQKIEEIGFDSEGILEKRTFKYDEKNRLNKVFFYNPKELEMKCVYEYDLKNKQLKYSFYDLDNKENFIFEYIEKYDKKQNVIEIVEYNVNHKLKLKTLFEYNKNQDKILAKRYNSYKELKNTFSYKYEKYDAKGNWVKQVVCKNDVPIEIVERKFEYFE